MPLANYLRRRRGGAKCTIGWLQKQKILISLYKRGQGLVTPPRNFMSFEKALATLLSLYFSVVPVPKFRESVILVFNLFL